MVRRLVHLQGHPFDLEDLPAMFTSPALRVVHERGEYFLEASAFSQAPSDVAIIEEAERLMAIINGAARLHSRSYRNVVIGSQIEEYTSSGERKMSAVVRPATIDVRGKVHPATVKVGEEQSAPSVPGSQVGDRRLELATRKEGVAEALEIWGAKPHNWHNLYAVLEIIGSDAIVERGWATRKEIRRFKHNANHPEGGGRHARSNMKRPRRPMTLSEGDAFVERVFVAWLDSLP